ncbi:hypothetical protein KP509_09G006000 [Ceratopteris richardii]|uniref:Uncharacterized protein n=1 Tax=Ceratopteris richardii TaxID=49495 RepID=A0A8T2U1K7_CERRI|nr:hypothetical protein KP509_09G006000 [Ceratopteris richardii]
MADVEMQDASHASAEQIFKAAETGDFLVFQELSRDQLLRTCSLRNDDSRTPLHVAVSFGQEEIVKILCNLPGSSQTIVNVADEEGWTPLHSAVSCGQLSIMEILLQAGADVSAKTTGGRTPLHYAASKGHTKIAEVLVASGANINEKDMHSLDVLHCIGLQVLDISTYVKF